MLPLSGGFIKYQRTFRNINSHPIDLISRPLQTNKPLIFPSTNSMMPPLLLLLLVCWVARSQLLPVHSWPAGQAHSGLIVSIQFYNDNSRFVAGSKDHRVTIWSATTYQLLGSCTMADEVLHVGLHPATNRIYAFDYLDNYVELDPQTYAAVRVVNATGLAANTIQFFASNSKYFVSGYEVGTTSMRIYNTATNALIAGGLTNIFAPTALEVTVSAVSRSRDLVALISGETSGTISMVLINLTSNTVVKTFSDFSHLLKFVRFGTSDDNLYLTSNDMTLRKFSINPKTSQYDISYSLSTVEYGYPNDISTELADLAIFAANNSLVFLNTTTPYPKVEMSRKDQADVFVLDVSPNGEYLVTGMKSGEMSLWRIGQLPTNKDQDIFLLIVLGSVAAGLIFIIVVGILIWKYCCVSPQVASSDGSKAKSKKRKEQKVNQKTLESLGANNEDYVLGNEH